MKKGKIIIISAPSGCGKSTIIGHLMDRGKLDMQFSVSATNREPRNGEVDGVNYHFLSTDDFKDAIANNQFIEFEEVYPGRFYGTLKSEVEHRCELGENVILDIDVKGGVRVKELYGNLALSLFIMPPSVDELERRLRSRATDSDDAIKQRLDKAEYEISFANQFDHIIVNDNLKRAVEEAETTITDFLKK